MDLTTGAVNFSKQDYNCSQCMLKAAELAYGCAIPDDALKMCAGVSSGFGIGCICSCLIAGIMIFGLLFDENTVKRLRLIFLSDFAARHAQNSCSRLKCDDSCEALIREIAALADAIIKENISG